MNTLLSCPSFSTLPSLFGYSVSRFVSFCSQFILFPILSHLHRSAPIQQYIYIYISAPQQKQQQQQLQIHPSRPPVIATSSMPSVSSEPIPDIDQLYSPKFPLEVVREFVMEALRDAVEINQVHNRDPIGWTNENLFL